MTATARSPRRVSEPEENLAGLIRMLRLPEPEREYPFAEGIGRRWRFDFAWSDRMLAVEVEGGAYVNGRHNRGAGFEADATKYATAVVMGWRVLRLTPRMIDSGEAIELIQQALAA